MIKIPALVGRDFQPVRAGHTAFGWSVFLAKSEDEARAFMAAYPQAAMPCWRRPDFFEVAS